MSCLDNFLDGLNPKIVVRHNFAKYMSGIQSGLISNLQPYGEGCTNHKICHGYFIIWFLIILGAPMKNYNIYNNVNSNVNNYANSEIIRKLAKTDNYSLFMALMCVINISIALRTLLKSTASLDTTVSFLMQAIVLSCPMKSDIL